MTNQFIYKKNGLLHKALRHLPLPIIYYHYDENAIANLLSFVKLVDEFYIICNKISDDVLYVQNKDNEKYLQLHRNLSTVCTTWTSARQK